MNKGVEPWVGWDELDYLTLKPFWNPKQMVDESMAHSQRSTI